ncbi:MAG TPA: uroporphyrinogen decarboxylase family protein [Deltaproteobacteria bacterium]|nr:uroporphyrinogen decarboxylase family protein [Deltaproteobacteria bacterium]
MAGAGPFLIAPVASGLGIRITGTEARENILSPDVQAASVTAFLDRFPDVDIVFPVMDTSVEARALNCPFEFKGRVPVISGHPFEDPDALNGLSAPDPQACETMADNVRVVARIARDTGRPVGAFVVGPVTLAAHLLGATCLVRLAARDTSAFGGVLGNCLRFIRPYALALAAAGASHIAILEPQLIFFSPAVYERSVRSRIEDLACGLPSPILHVCGDTRRHLAAFALTAHVQVLSLDAAVDFSAALDATPGLSGKTLMGNISPVEVLHRGTPGLVRETVESLVKSMRGRHFILSSGCDMVPDTPLENMEAFMQTALSLR